MIYLSLLSAKHECFQYFCKNITTIIRFSLESYNLKKNVILTNKRKCKTVQNGEKKLANKDNLCTMLTENTLLNAFGIWNLSLNRQNMTQRNDWTVAIIYNLNDINSRYHYTLHQYLCMTLYCVKVV